MSKEATKRKRQFYTAMVNDPDFPDHALGVAWIILDCLREEHGYSFPSVRYLAEQVGKTKRAVDRAIKDLKASGWFTIKSGGPGIGQRGGWSNQYHPNWSKLASNTDEGDNGDDGAVHGDTEVTTSASLPRDDDADQRQNSPADISGKVTTPTVRGNDVYGTEVTTQTSSQPVYIELGNKESVPSPQRRARFHAPRADDVTADDHSKLADLVGWELLQNLERADVDRLALDYRANGSGDAICQQAMALAKAAPD